MHGSLQAHKAVHVHVQAVVNEDLSGEAAAMLAEIARLSTQNASLKSEVALLQQARALHYVTHRDGKVQQLHCTCPAVRFLVCHSVTCSQPARW